MISAIPEAIVESCRSAPSIAAGPVATSSNWMRPSNSRPPCSRFGMPMWRPRSARRLRWPRRSSGPARTAWSDRAATYAFLTLPRPHCGPWRSTLGRYLFANGDAERIGRESYGDVAW